MGFRAVVTTPSLHRTKPWPEWFTTKWSISFDFVDRSTLCSPKMEIKNVLGFIDDYSRALNEIGWEFMRHQSYGAKIREHAMTVCLLWDCGGAQRVKIWPDGPENWTIEHGDSCEHDWRFSETRKASDHEGTEAHR